MDDPTIPSNVGPAPAEQPKTTIKSSPNDATKDAADARADSPPAAPKAKRELSTAQPTDGSAAGASKAGPGTKPAQPVAPGSERNEPVLEPAPGADNTGAATRRDNLRPIYSTRSPRLELRNVLIGRVESDAGEPLGEVPVTVTSRDNSAIRRDGMTNAFGNFAIRLGEGQWTVNVRMPSGRVYPVRSIRVANGKIVDNQEGREVRNLIISY